MREHTADRQLQRAHRRFRVRAVREPRPASGRGHVVRHADVLIAGTAVRHAAVQSGGHGRVGHRRRAVHDGQQRAAVPGRPQGGDAQETGIGRNVGQGRRKNHFTRANPSTAGGTERRSSVAT